MQYSSCGLGTSTFFVPEKSREEICQIFLNMHQNNPTFIPLGNGRPYQVRVAEEGEELTTLILEPISDARFALPTSYSILVRDGEVVVESSIWDFVNWIFLVGHVKSTVEHQPIQNMEATSFALLASVLSR
jgi:hypothetical protein